MLSYESTFAREKHYHQGGGFSEKSRYMMRNFSHLANQNFAEFGSSPQPWSPLSSADEIPIITTSKTNSSSQGGYQYSNSVNESLSGSYLQNRIRDEEASESMNQFANAHLSVSHELSSSNPIPIPSQDKLEGFLYQKQKPNPENTNSNSNIENNNRSQSDERTASVASLSMAASLQSTKTLEVMYNGGAGSRFNSDESLVGHPYVLDLQQEDCELEEDTGDREQLAFDLEM